MINEKRVEKMSQLAIYENTIGKEPFSLYEYSKKDYIGWQLIKNFIGVTISYIICVLSLSALKIEYILDNWLEIDYFNIGLWLVVSYGTIMLISTLITIKIFKKKYKIAQKKMERYIQLVEQVCECYEKEREE